MTEQNPPSGGTPPGRPGPQPGGTPPTPPPASPAPAAATPAAGASRPTPLGAIVGLIGGAIIIVSIFLKWYGITASASFAGRSVSKGETRTLWDFLKHPDEGKIKGRSADWLAYGEYVVAAVAVIAVIVALVMLLQSSGGGASTGLASVLVVVGVIGVIYIGYRLLFGPGNFTAIDHINRSVGGITVKATYDREIGAIIAFIGSILILVGGFVGARR
jgi:hypothetical protein